MPKERPEHPFARNLLLSLLPDSEHQRLGPLLTATPLPFKFVLAHPNEPMRYVYFPTSGVVSALAVMLDGASIEVGTVGREGVANVVALLGMVASPHKNIMQVAGEAYRMDAKVFAQELTRDGPLRDVLRKYQSYFMTYMSQSVACNGLHSVQQRCCRWLLVTRERMDDDELPLTHEFLGIMLGVRRVTVTLTLNLLQEQGLVKVGRGNITLTDTNGLRKLACECFQVVRDGYKRLVTEA
jgi:CRP-like cAMP-binding protein